MATSPLAYRSALALNNMAVTLLQRGRYSVALKTLNDSLELIRLACEPNCEGSFSKELEIFKYASKRYGKALRSRASKRPVEVEANPIDDDDLAGMRSAAKYGPSSTIVFPIRISESPDSETQYNDMARQFGIILFNHGLVNFLASRKHRDSKTGKYIRRSHKSLKMAESTLLSVVEDDENSGELSSLLLSALVLNSMSVLLHYQDLACQAEEAQHVVSLLCSSFDEGFITSILVQRHFAPAA